MVFVLLAGAFLPIMDFFITNVALPSIDASLHASASQLELVIAGYGVAYAALLVLGGRLGDRFGHRRLFLGALLGFVAASASCGFAPTVGVLIAARIVQGATAALSFHRFSRRSTTPSSTSARRVRWPCTAPRPGSQPWSVSW